MEKRYTVRQAVTMTGVKSYVLRYWEEELDLRIGRNELGHRYYTPFDIQLFLKINELKNRGLQLKAIRTLIPQEARNTYPSDLAKTGSEILEGEAVEIEDIPVGTPEEAAEDMFMEKQKTSKEHREDDKKILEFQEILERLIHEEMPAMSMKTYADAFKFWMIGVVDPDGTISSTLRPKIAKLKVTISPGSCAPANGNSAIPFPPGPRAT